MVDEKNLPQFTLTAFPSNSSLIQFQSKFHSGYGGAYVATLYIVTAIQSDKE